MNKFKSIPFSLLLALLTFQLTYSGCSKERIEGKEEEEQDQLNEYNDVSEYFDQKKQEEQEIEVDSGGSGPIKGKEGTNIWINKECLMFPNGDSVSWPFTVKLIELYSAKDMIYYQMPTVAGGIILETAGEIRLRAFKDETELVIRPTCFAQIEMPNSSPKSNMRVFYGFDTSGQPDWTDDLASLGVSSSVSPTFSATATGYMAAVARLGWINCGQLAGNGTGHTITFTSSTDHLQNVGIFVYFPATKSLMQVYNSTSGVIPDASSIKLIGIGIDAGGKTFGFDDQLTVSSNLSANVKLNAISDSDLTTLLDGL